MFKKILLPTDGSEYAEKTIQTAIGVAKLAGAAVVVMYAYTPLGPFRKRGAAMLEEFKTSLEDEGREIVSEVSTRLQAQGLTVSGLVVEGPASEAILRAADEEQPDLVIMGSRGGGGLPDLRLGSVADRVVRHLKVPVLVVK
jgi:nucleotide-binding universal stress UspA family protein